MFVAALYTDGKITTGTNHGEAFSKLNTEEQNGNLKSGFLDSDTGKFISDEGAFYLKEILLIRHGQCENGYLNDIGKEQVSKTASYLKNFNLTGYQIKTSPSPRCIQTAEIIRDITGFQFEVEDKLQEHFDNEPNFIDRIITVLNKLTARTLLITHSDVIYELIHSAISYTPEIVVVPYASITFVNNHRLVFMGRI